MSDNSEPRMAQAYEIQERGLTIDGEHFPFFLEEGGPRVEQIEPGLPLHILWLPVLVEAPLAGYMHEKPGQSAEPVCANHKPVQHRDGKPPWCNTCRKR